MRLNKNLALRLGRAKQQYDYDRKEYVVEKVDVDLKNVTFVAAGLFIIGLALWSVITLVYHSITTHQATHNRYVQACDYMAGKSYHYVTGDSYVTECNIVHLTKNGDSDIAKVQIN